MTEFFIEKFTYDHYSTLRIIDCMEEHEEQLSAFAIRSLSHLINVHHIWLSRLKGSIAESKEWDLLPLAYFRKLQEENFQETLNYLQFAVFEETLVYRNSEGEKLEKYVSNVLYHLLNHATHHRAQIIYDIKQRGIPIPSVNFISFK